MLEATKKNNLSELITSKGRLWQVKQKKWFKAKTRKGGLNHKKKAKRKEKGQVENLKRWLDQEKRFLD